MIIAKRLALPLVFLLVATPAFAGIGIHVGMDMSKIDAELTDFRFTGDPTDYGTSTLERTETGNPMNIGLDLSIGFLPVIDLLLSVEAGLASYDVTFTPADAAQLAGAQVVNETGVPFLRAGADLSLAVSVFKFPPMIGTFNFLVGGGPSVGIIAPIVSSDLLTKEIASADAEVDPVELASIEAKFGFHLMGGIKIKPPLFPMGLRLTGKYYIFSGVEEPGKSSWLTVQAGIFIGG